MIEPAFRILLTNDPTVSGMVTDRVYLNVAAQNERRPRIVLTLISGVPGFTFQGRGGHVNGRMQVNCLAATYMLAKQLAAAARNALDSYSGTVDGTPIVYIETENQRDIPAIPLEGSASPTFGVSVDTRFMHKE